MNFKNLPIDFDWKEYLRLNPDLRQEISEKRLAKYHWCTFGYKEGRKYKDDSFVEFNSITTIPKILYTCITGSYDTLLPVKPEKDWRYICFSDTIQANKIGYWEIFKISSELTHLDDTRKARYIKINSLKYLPEHICSLWIDGNIRIKSNSSLETFLYRYTLEKNMVVVKHPKRNCIYKEAEAVLWYKKDDIDIVNAQMQKYRQDKYPENNGLISSGIIFRRQNEQLQKFEEMWCNEILHHSKRDQLSFNYVQWKLDFPVDIIHENIFYSSFFQLESHKKSENK